jgi:formylglycine-generating enzyme required for sulfatase activity
MIAVPGYSGGHYCIAETETTEELYDKVNSSASTTTSQYPEVNLYYSSASSFTTNLTQLLGITFRMPTSDEWTFAAKGGNRSKGYTYAGSDNIDEVAWYKENASSKQEVKQKMPNELGIYDMSGNVAEFVNQQYKYDDTYYYYYGGSYYHSSSDCTISSTSYTGYKSYIGFRFVMPY